MKIVKYNKLIRDNIPQYLESIGKSCKTSVLNNDDYLNKLKEKVCEEANEVANANDINQLVEELADLKEVVLALLKATNVSQQEVEQQRIKKLNKKGGFANKLLLQEVIEND